MATGPLKVHATNKRYFTDGSGKAIYLTGSHIWYNLKDRVPGPLFNYSGYLSFLVSKNHNFMRMWTWELARYSYRGGPIRNTIQFPWPRTGSGTALDGKRKFDLSKLNQSYFDRLRSRVIQARDKGIYVSIMLFEGHGMQFSDSAWRWKGHPFHAANNINGINGDPNNDGKGTETHTLSLPKVTAIQRAYVKKVVDTVNDLPNVLYEIANETWLVLDELSVSHDRCRQSSSGRKAQTASGRDDVSVEHRHERGAVQQQGGLDLAEARGRKRL